MTTLRPLVLGAALLLVTGCGPNLRSFHLADRMRDLSEEQTGPSRGGGAGVTVGAPEGVLFLNVRAPGASADELAGPFAIYSGGGADIEDAAWARVDEYRRSHPHSITSVVLFPDFGEGVRHSAKRRLSGAKVRTDLEAQGSADLFVTLDTFRVDIPSSTGTIVLGVRNGQTSQQFQASSELRGPFIHLIWGIPLFLATFPLSVAWFPATISAIGHGYQCDGLAFAIDQALDRGLRVTPAPAVAPAPVQPPPVEPPPVAPSSPLSPPSEPASVPVPTPMPKPVATLKEPDPPGRLEVVSTTAATIALDGEPRGPTPITLQAVTNGPHRLVASFEGGSTSERSFEVRPNQTTRLELALPPYAHRSGVHVGASVAFEGGLGNGPWLGGRLGVPVNVGLGRYVDLRTGVEGRAVKNLDDQAAYYSATVQLGFQFNLGSTYSLSLGGEAGYLLADQVRLGLIEYANRPGGPAYVYGDVGAFVAGPRVSLLGFRFGSENQIELGVVAGVLFPAAFTRQIEDRSSLIFGHAALQFTYLVL